MLVYDRNGKDVRSARLQGACNLLENLLRIEDVLVHILSHVKIDAFVGKRECLKIFAAHFANHASERSSEKEL